MWLIPPDLEAMTREGSAQHAFAGAGMNLDVMSAALLYALVQTGFAEEFLLRGLITGTSSRAMSVLKANPIQSVIFLAPHLLLLFIMPKQRPLLVLIFVGASYAGWIRIRSGSIPGPWLIHGGVNLAVTLSVLIRTMPSQLLCRRLRCVTPPRLRSTGRHVVNHSTCHRGQAHSTASSSSGSRSISIVH